MTPEKAIRLIQSIKNFFHQRCYLLLGLVWILTMAQSECAWGQSLLGMPYIPSADLLEDSERSPVIPEPEKSQKDLVKKVKIQLIWALMQNAFPALPANPLPYFSEIVVIADGTTICHEARCSLNEWDAVKSANIPSPGIYIERYTKEKNAPGLYPTLQLYSNGLFNYYREVLVKSDDHIESGDWYSLIKAAFFNLERFKIYIVVPTKVSIPSSVVKSIETPPTLAKPVKPGPDRVPVLKKKSLSKDLTIVRPAYPSKLVGPSLQALGSTGMFVMELDPTYGGKIKKGNLPQEKDAIDFQFTLHNITEIAKKGLDPDSSNRWLHDTPNPGRDVTKWAGEQRGLGRKLEDLGEDTAALLIKSLNNVIQGFKKKGKELSRELKNFEQSPSLKTALNAASVLPRSALALLPSTRIDEATQVIADIIAGRKSTKIIQEFNERGIDEATLALTPSSLLVALGGSAIGAIATGISDSPSEREIPWSEEGIFLVRCIATPKARGGKVVAPSVAIKIVEVRSSSYLALNTINSGYAVLEETALAYALESDPNQKKSLKATLDELKVEMQGDVVQVLTLAIQKKQAAQKVASADYQEVFEKEIEQLTRQHTLAKKRIYDHTGPVFRPEVAFASEVSSITYPLLIQLFPHTPENGLKKWILSDVSSPHGITYTGIGLTDEAAIWDAFHSFSSNNDYGRGSLAIRLPGKAKLPGIERQSSLLRNVPRGTALFKNRLMDLTVVLTALSFFIPGVGEVAMVLTGAMASVRIIERIHHGTLSFDAALVGDLIAILGVAGSGLGALGKFRMAQIEGRFALAKQSADIAKIQSVAKNIKSATAFFEKVHVANEFINSGGLLWGNVQLLRTLAEVSSEELSGKITHTQARRKRVEALAEGLQNNALYLHGMLRNSNIKGIIEKQCGELPPLEFNELDFRAGITERMLPADRLAKMRGYLGENFVQEHPEATSPEKIYELQGAVLGNDVHRLADSAQLKTGEPSLERGVEHAAQKLVEFEGFKEQTGPQARQALSAYKASIKTNVGTTADLLVSFEAVVALPNEGTHGVDSGFARYSLNRNGNRWEAKIVLHERVLPGEVRHLAIHELTEISRIIKEYPQADQKTIRKQMEAGLFQKGVILEPRAHDYAAGRQLFEYYHDLGILENRLSEVRKELIELDKKRAQGEAVDEVLAKQKLAERGKLVDNASKERARIKRMFEAMGLKEVSDPEACKKRMDALVDMLGDHLEEARLRSSDPKALNELETTRTKMFLEVSDMRINIEAQAAKVRTGRDVSTELIKHLLYPKVEFGQFKRQGIMGGHLESELMRFQRAKPEVYFIEVAQQKIGNTLVKKFEQWLYKGGKEVPKPDELPNQPNFNKEYWKKAEAINAQGVPETLHKTTVDRLDFLLDEGLPAYDQWLMTNSSEVLDKIKKSSDYKDENKFSESIRAVVTSKGFAFSGYASYDKTTQTWSAKTLYPEIP